MKKLILGLSLICALSACSINKQSLGLGKNSPDEFVVMKRKPLSMPPDYNLTPPKPGTKSNQQSNTSAEAERILFGSNEVESKDFSKSDKSFLDDINATDTQANIRDIVNEELENDPANNKYLINELMSWRKEDNSAVINNTKEAKRLKNNQTQGLSINEGYVPVLNNTK